MGEVHTSSLNVCGSGVPMSDEARPALDVKAIKARERAASKGPWSRGRQANLEHVVFKDSTVDGLAENVVAEFANSNRESDAEFTAHARTDIQDLIAEVEHLRAGEARSGWRITLDRDEDDSLIVR